MKTATGFLCQTHGANELCSFYTDRAEAFFTVAGFVGWLVGLVAYDVLFGRAV